MRHHTQTPIPPLELWGGIECTVNRLKDEFRDQTVRSGHHRRLCDLDRIAELGIKTLRYPVLWERVAPSSLGDPDWQWTDERLHKLRDLVIEPIAGLLHHGSGPIYTSLVDPKFPQKFARYARMVAERYPWLRYYTPINEPLTTARFCALYGHWYPHERNASTFATALLNQCRATILAMREIRQVQPCAQLVQTDDLGMVHSTTKLRYQASHENQRRWLAFDLLCGKVSAPSPMGRYLRYLGIPQAELDWFRANPCPPDIVGINHYLTSERYLDHRIQNHPADRLGSNGRHVYADLEAYAACRHRVAGPERLLSDVWNRYQIPVAITEVHLAAKPDHQMRWLHQIWTAAQTLRAQGAKIPAVTVWSLFGAYDWNSLVTRDAGFYEPGVFDVTGPEPRHTPLATMVKSLATRGSFYHPCLDEPGWWRNTPVIPVPLHKPLAAES